MRKRGLLWVGVVAVALAGLPDGGRIEATELDRAGGAPGDAPAPPSRYALTLGGVEFDPVHEQPDLPDGWDRSSASTPDLHLVQLHGATRQDDLETLKSRGLEIVQYIYPHSYVVWGTPSQRVAVEREGFVRWTGDFAPAFRLQPQWRQLDSTPQQVRALIYRGAGGDAVVEAIESLGGRASGRKVLNDTFEIAGFTLPGDRLRAAAGVPGVYSLRPVPTDGGLRGEMSNQVNVNNVDAGNAAFPGYQSWLAGAGVDGSGVVMANVDGGVNESHPDLVNRMLSCTGSTCSGTTSSHGTHTAGIMGADGSSGSLDTLGFLRGLGVAPGAMMFEQVYSPTFTQAGGMLTLMQQSFANGAVVSGNSWGPAGSPQGYDDDTLQVDIGVRDSDPATPGNQQFHYVLSFMNGNGGTSSQGSPDEAKNLFNIGSTKMQTSAGAQDLGIDDLSANTAHGPALDGRTIPHMVAPGCYVDSTDTTASTYGLKCGTSMASPHVTGAVALFFEYYRGLPTYVRDPSPALVKAAFLAVAKSLAGNQDADGGALGQPFDSKQGWGRMDLPAVVTPPANSARYFDEEVLFDDTGEEWSSTLSPLNPALPVRIMLAWTDAPGHGLGGSTPAWNNNLDLVVEAGGDSYLGNVFDASGISTTGGTADPINNTEGVFLSAAAASGGFTIRVLASDINSDGVPSVGDATDQDFAVACYNCALEPSFTLAVPSAEKAACAPSSTAFEVQVDSILGFSDPVTLSASNVPAEVNASFTVDPVVPPGSSSLQLDASPEVTPGKYQVTIDAVSGSINRSVAVELSLFQGIPGPTDLLMPADGAIEVGLVPPLVWADMADAESYVLQVAADPGFDDIVYAAHESGTSLTVPFPLQESTTYHWRVRPSNTCGTGIFSPSRSFTTRAVPDILLVDDDDNAPDVRASYADALTVLARPFDVWDTNNSDNEPDMAELSQYSQVIWFTGDEFGGVAGPGPAGEQALAAWLDDSNCLMVNSQDYFYDRGQTQLMGTYLGLLTATSDVGQGTVTGQGSVFSALGPYALAFPYTNYTDTLVPDATAELAFDGDAGSPTNAAINKDSGVYRTAFLSFGVEGLPADSDRQDVLSTFLGWCDVLPGQDPDSDGATNATDCAPTDAAVWAVPTPARDLNVTLAPVDNVTWSAPLDPGATTVSYDLLRAEDVTDLQSAACLLSDSAATTATDATDPVSGTVYYYVVRVANACGETLGRDSLGIVRTATECP